MDNEVSGTPDDNATLAHVVAGATDQSADPVHAESYVYPGKAEVTGSIPASPTACFAWSEASRQREHRYALAAALGGIRRVAAKSKYQVDAAGCLMEQTRDPVSRC
jgi:hypothetical protein